MRDVGQDERAAAGGEELTDVFEQHRRLLFSVAYDMLGSVTDAEDCVQEGWLRWARDDRSDVAAPKSYLVRIVTRVALDRLRSAAKRRETYVGPWLPEPLLTSPDVAEEVERAESVSLAMLVVLETLSPVERAVFVLREVFGLPHAEIAATLERSEVSVRQLAHRAKEHVHARRPRYTPDAEERRRVTERFLAACVEGDVDGLKAMFSEDVTFRSDGGGKVRAARRPIQGADKVARFLASIMQRWGSDYRIDFTDVNGAPGIVVHEGDSVAYAGLLEMDGGLVSEILFVGNPDKLP